MSPSCRLNNVRASLLLVLVVADVLVGRTAGVWLRRRHGSPLESGAPPPPTDDDGPATAAENGDASTALEADVLGLRRLVGDGWPRHRQQQQHRRRHGSPAAERVVVPEYMWQLYQRQRRANGERQHGRAPTTATGQSMTSVPPPYTANIIRSFVATSFDDTSATGELSRNVYTSSISFHLIASRSNWTGQRTVSNSVLFR